MFKQLKKLHELQDVDAERWVLEREKEEIPKRLKKLDIEIKKREFEIKKILQELLDLQKRKKDNEFQNHELSQQLTKYRSHLNEVKTNKEYKAVQQEIADTQVKIERIEEEILVIMEKIDLIKDNVKQKEKEILEIIQNIKKEKDALKKRRSVLDKEIKKHLSNREGMLEGIDEEYLSIYDRLSRNKEAAVVIVRHGNTCSGCGTLIRPQMILDIRRNDKIIRCEHCGRILYWDPEKSKE